MNIKKSSLFLLLLAISTIGFADTAVHCPRTNYILPMTNDGGGFYASMDGLFTPWAGRTMDGIQHTHFKFQEIEFYTSNGSDYYFNGCFYTADGVPLKIMAMDGSAFWVHFRLPPNFALSFKKKGDLLVCDTSEVGCGFLFS